VPPARGAERRRQPRLTIPFPTRVRGRSTEGAPFECDTAVENISRGGLYVVVPGWVDLQARMLFVVTLTPGGGRPGARVALRGRVVRAEPRPGGEYGIAVVIEGHRFLEGRPA
jgi:hypothetical protein